MQCWECEEPARASCYFCGRFVCKKHAKTMPSFLAMFLGGDQTPKGLAVADAIWCGICELQPEPIPMPELY
jgi:hypothetical protein